MSLLTYQDILSGLGSEYNTFPLSSSQERLWFLHRLHPGDPPYPMCGAVRLKGRLDTARLAGAVRSLCERHEALRTVFHEIEDRPVQAVSAEALASLEVLPLGGADVGGTVAAHARR